MRPVWSGTSSAACVGLKPKPANDSGSALLLRLAGTLVEVKFVPMMIEIVKIVLVPIAAALLHDHLKTVSPVTRSKFQLAAIGSAAWLAFLCFGGWTWLAALLGPTALLALELASFLVGAIVGGVVYHAFTRVLPRLDAWMPAASMASWRLVAASGQEAKGQTCSPEGAA